MPERWEVRGHRLPGSALQGEFRLPASAARTPSSDRWDVGVVFMFPGTLFLPAGTNCLGNDISESPALPASAGKGEGRRVKCYNSFGITELGYLAVPREAGIQRDDAGQNLHART